MGDDIALSGVTERTATRNGERARPPLSVVIPARGGLAEAAPALRALVPMTADAGVELLVVGGAAETVGANDRAREATPPDGDAVRLISTPVTDMLALHRRGLEEARGDVVAIGEDHAVPRPGWCEAVIRAHAEHPEAAAVAGCLVNATDSTLVGRANFLAFAAAWQPPMATLPAGRPPPASTLSFKRKALEGVGSKAPGWLEAELIPSLFAQGLIVADDRIVVDHHQDHGSLWSIRNAYDSARSSYGYTRPRLDPPARRKLARWAIRGVPRQLRTEASEASRGTRIGQAESTLLSLIVTAAGLGAAAGALRGPGRSGERVA